MDVCKTGSAVIVLACSWFGVAGCSFSFFQRVPDDGYPACDEPDCSGYGPANVDTALAITSGVLAITHVAIGASGPEVCLIEEWGMCADVSTEFYAAAGVYALAAVVYGLSAGFGHAWAKDCEAAWDAHNQWLAKQGRGPEAEPPVGDGNPRASSPTDPLKQPVQDLSCPPGSRVLGKLPPAGWERFCARVLPSGMVVRHGPARTWFDTGRVASEGAYHEGERHGGWAFWYSDGQVRLEATYHRGQKVGAWKRWSRDGVAQPE